MESAVVYGTNVCNSKCSFSDLYNENTLHVDKTMYLYDLICRNSGTDNVTFMLLSHFPRRFGKSSMLSLLDHYFRSPWPEMTVDDAKCIAGESQAQTDSNLSKSKTFKDLPLWKEAVRMHGDLENLEGLEKKFIVAAKDLLKRYNMFSATLFFKKHPDVFDSHFAKYPVISVSFMNLFDSECSIMERNLSHYLKKVCRQFIGFGYYKSTLGQGISDMLESLTAGTMLSYQVLWNLSNYLAEAFMRPCIALVDEYDHALQEALLVHMKSGKSDSLSVIENTRFLITRTLSTLIKGNDDAVCGAVIMGITPLILNNTDSGLNILIPDCMFATVQPGFVGFTRNEALQLLKEAQPEIFNDENKLHDFTILYDGYYAWTLANKVHTELFCPWSVMSACKMGSFEEYWGRTGTWNSIDTKATDCCHLVSESSLEVQLSKVANEVFLNQVIQWLHGETVQVNIQTDIHWVEFVKGEADALSSYFLYSGYLTRVVDEPGTSPLFADLDRKMTLKVPNIEVKRQWLKLVVFWLQKATDHSNVSVSEKSFQSWTVALIRGDHEPLCAFITRFLQHSVSYFDLQSSNENIYHLLVLGIVSFLEYVDYSVSSNRESGDGRYDILSECKNEKDLSVYDLIFEFKYSKTFDDMDKDVKAGLNQIQAKNYVHACRNPDRKKLLFSFAFHKKNCKYDVKKLEQ